MCFLVANYACEYFFLYLNPCSWLNKIFLLIGHLPVAGRSGTSSNCCAQLAGLLPHWRRPPITSLAQVANYLTGTSRRQDSYHPAFFAVNKMLDSNLRSINHLYFLSCPLKTLLLLVFRTNVARPPSKWGLEKRRKLSPLFVTRCCKLTVSTSSSSDPLVSHGRHFGRTMFALCNYPSLLTNGILRLEQMEDTPLEDFPAE